MENIPAFLHERPIPGTAYLNAPDKMEEGESVGIEIFDDLEYLHRISICLRTLSQFVSQERRAAFLIGYTTYLTVRDKLSVAEREIVCQTMFTASIYSEHLLALWDNFEAFSRREWFPPGELSYVNIDGRRVTAKIDIDGNVIVWERE